MCFRVVIVVRARRDEAVAFDRAAVAADGRFFADGEKAIGRGFGRGFWAGGEGKDVGSGRGSLVGCSSVGRDTRIVWGILTLVVLEKATACP